jgi:hypothetical protein
MLGLNDTKAIAAASGILSISGSMPSSAYLHKASYASHLAVLLLILLIA